MTKHPVQPDLFNVAIIDCYKENGTLTNKQLYRLVAAKLGYASPEDVQPVGKHGAMHNVFARKVRWHQQTLKNAGVLKATARGVWECVTTQQNGLSLINTGHKLIAFSTKLGVALLSSAEDAFKDVDVPISLILTSPPYPLTSPRKYGNPKVGEYVDWLCGVLEPVIKNMRDGASLCLNICNDVFNTGSAARSTYCERLVIALEDNFGLHLMDRLIWNNTSRPPGPIQYASIRRVQLNATYEPIYWFTNNPDKVFSDNRRVLLPHTETHAKLIAAGGESRAVADSDGAHRKRIGSYSNKTEGKIPRNILEFSHTCQDQRNYKAFARSRALPAHGAPMPLSLAKFLVEFLTAKNDVVADPFAGSFTTCKAAEMTGRRWFGTDRVLQYLMGASSRFLMADGYESTLFA